MRYKQASYVVGFMLLPLAVCAANAAVGREPRKAPGTPPRSTAAAPTETENVEGQIRGLIHQEVVAEFARSGQSPIKQAEESQQRAADSQAWANRTLDIVQKWTAIVAAVISGISVAIVIVGLTGFREVRALGNIRKEAGEAVEHVKRIRESITTAIEELAERFAETPPAQREELQVAGQPAELPSPQELARYEEADIVLVLGDKIRGAKDARTLVAPFVTLGEYWRSIDNYPRAVARFQRALELNRDSVEAQRGLARTLGNIAAQPGISPLYGARMLDEAERIQRALLARLGRNADCLHDLGWIYDERQQYEQAVQFYTEALSLSDRSHTRYDLACSYAKWRKYPEALEELAKIIENSNHREDAGGDKDFAELRDDPTFGPTFAELLRRDGG